MSTYQVGDGPTQIKLAVDLDTVGLAASRALVLDLNSSDPSITVGKSLDATGDIPRKDIGTAASLKNKRLSILTKIDLIAGSTADKKRESERLTMKYILEDGSQGHAAFTDPDKIVADDFSTVILFKEVDLI